MKYAVSEKNLLDLQGEKNRLEKKKKEALSENELLQHKLSSMMSEKSRICQMLDNKVFGIFYTWVNNMQRLYLNYF